MERGERVEMNPEIGKINDNLDKVKKSDTKNQKIDIDSPVKVGKDIKAKQADTADAGKNLRDKISDFVNRPTEIPRRFYGSYLERYNRVPKNDGEWTGRIGESVFKSNKPEVIEAQKKYGIEGIKYTDCIPDFSPVADTSVKINMTKNIWDNYPNADAVCAEKWNKEKRNGRNDWTGRDVKTWRNENKFTWHECTDRKTCQLIPREIHDAYRHTGGRFECGLKGLQKDQGVFQKFNNIFDK